MDKNENQKMKRSSIKGSLVIVVILLALDVGFLGSGLYSVLFAVVVLFVLLPIAVFKKDKEIRRQKLQNIAVYIVGIVLVFALNYGNNLLAQHRAEQVVSAVKAYHQKNQRYPKNLEELVPEYMSHVPYAKYNVMGMFFYFSCEAGKPPCEDEPKATLMYAKIPPFGRVTYRFEEDKWGWID